MVHLWKLTEESKLGEYSEEEALSEEHSFWSSRHGAMQTNLTRNQEVVDSIPGLTRWVGDLVLP